MTSHRIKFTLAVIALTSLTIGGCASTTSADHAKRNAHISMQDLLGAPPTAEERRTMAHKSILIAIEAYSAKEYKVALRHAFSAIQNDPENIPARKIHAESLLQLGNYAESEKGFNTLLSMAPDAEVYQGYGLSSLNQDRAENGRSALLTATEIDPGLWRAWNGIGQSYAMESNWARADDAYQTALAINPNQPEIHNNIGLLLIAQNKITEAQAAFAAAKSMPNGDGIADNNYRLALALSGNIDQAFMGLSDLQRAQLYNTLGQSALHAQNKAGAIKFFKKAIAHYPSHYAEATRNLEAALITQ